MSLQKSALKELIKKLFAFYSIEFQLPEVDPFNEHIRIERKLSYGTSKCLTIEWDPGDRWKVCVPLDEKFNEVMKEIINFFKLGKLGSSYEGSNYSQCYELSLWEKDSSHVSISHTK